MLPAFVILAGALATGGIGCQQSFTDRSFGTDAGAGFEAPVREASVDGGAEAGDGDGGGAGDLAADDSADDADDTGADGG
jgi:hypothetical protein